MPIYTYRYSVMQYASVEARDITDAAIMARQALAKVPDAKLHDVIRTDPPIGAEETPKTDAP